MSEIFSAKYCYLISFIIIILAIGIIVKCYDKKRYGARRIVLMSVLIALAVVGRAAFFMIPQFKPMAAVVIIAGITMGANEGFVCGALSLFISNMIFGQGPWTPWQMLGFGIIGFFAGVLFEREYSEKSTLNIKDKLLLSIFGFASTAIIYGLLLDTATVFMSTDRPTKQIFIATYMAGVYFNVIHGVATVIFLWSLAGPMIKKINRINME